MQKVVRDGGSWSEIVDLRKMQVVYICDSESSIDWQIRLAVCCVIYGRPILFFDISGWVGMGR